jgi:hypothetical protein
VRYATAIPAESLPIGSSVAIEAHALAFEQRALKRRAMIRAFDRDFRIPIDDAPPRHVRTVR